MNKLLLSRRCTFSLRKYIYDSLYLNDPASQSEQIINSSIHTGIPNSNISTFNPVARNYQSTKLPSGITVLTESVGVPSNVNLGIFANVGSRDQTSQTSGSMLSLKNTYLKTSLNTSETVNYGIAQMSGGQFQVDFNRQSVFYRVNCLSHDVIDVFSMMADCAFEPKNFVAAHLGIYKNQQSHKLDAYLGGNYQFNDNIYSTAFGNSNLGMALNGNKSNVANLSAYVIQQFQSSFFTPDRIVISATGIQNHQEFVDLVNQKMFFTQLSNKSSTRSQAKYIGGQVRNLTQSSTIHAAFAFEGANHKDSIPLLLAQEILGNNRKSGRIQRSLLNKNVFVDNAQAFNANYEETGLFGLKISGSASHAQQIINVAAKQLVSLRTVSSNEVDLAKSLLINKISKQNSTTWKRLQARTKSLFYTGSTQENWISLIKEVSVQSVQNAVSKALKTPLTLVVQGGQVNRLSSYDNISKLFQ